MSGKRIISPKGSPKDDILFNDSYFSTKPRSNSSSMPKKKHHFSRFYLILFAFIIICIVGFLIICQFVSLRTLFNHPDKILYDSKSIVKSFIKEASILPNQTTDSTHNFRLDIDKIFPCNLHDKIDQNAEVETKGASTIMDENSYYSHHVNIKKNGWLYGQLCITPHSHEHVVEIYLAKVESKDMVEPKHDHDCDLYISAVNDLIIVIAAFTCYFFLSQ
jgi:hypothetical protein